MGCVSAPADPVAAHLRRELVARVQRVPDAAGVFAEASPRLRRLVPFDGAAWVSTDPGTGLPTAPSRIEQIGHPDVDQCLGYWRRELLAPDVNLYRDLARADVPAAALRATARDPERSARFRDYVRPFGFDDELRAVLRVGDTPWAVLALYRRPGQRPFSAEETALVAGLSAPLGEALRRLALPASRRSLPRDRPGMLLFDRDARLTAADDQARAWLDELPPDQLLPSDLGVRVPMWVMGTVLAALAARHGRGDGSGRARVRSTRGTWLVAHAACLRDSAGNVSGAVVAIEPATSSQIAPLLVQAYGLSEREREITSLIARGAATAEIADELSLSVHTVRDHVKAVFAKVGVSTRGELVATLFADHYAPEHLREVVRVDDGDDS